MINIIMVDYSELLMGIWSIIGELSPKRDRYEYALQIMHLFSDAGIDPAEFQDAIEEDGILERAFLATFDDDGEE